MQLKERGWMRFYKPYSEFYGGMLTGKVRFLRNGDVDYMYDMFTRAVRVDREYWDACVQNEGLVIGTKKRITLDAP